MQLPLRTQGPVTETMEQNYVGWGVRMRAPCSTMRSQPLRGFINPNRGAADCCDWSSTHLQSTLTSGNKQRPARPSPNIHYAGCAARRPRTTSTRHTARGSGSCTRNRSTGSDPSPAFALPTIHNTQLAH
eukprot:4103979-Prymnesium_polylepis.2